MAAIFILFITLLAGPIRISDWRSDQTHAARAVIREHVANGFSGSVLIAKNKEVILSEGYGYTSPDMKYQINPNTRFNIASMTKTITATGIMILIEDEKLDTRTSLRELFAEIPDDKERITVHQLLTHSSGLPQKYVTSGISEGEKAMKRIWKTKLEFSPGTNFAYSNLNYQVLARIIEVRSGLSYEEFCYQRILKPAGMKNTHFWNEIDHKDETAVAQKIEAFKGNYQERNWDYLGSGGAFSSAEDLHSFFIAFLENRLVGPEKRADMLSKQQEIRPGLYCGYGWFISPDTEGQLEYWTRGNESFGHNGVLRWFPNKELLIIVQSNTGEKGSPTQTDNRLVSDDLVKTFLSNELN